MGEKTRTGQALGDRPLRGCRLVNGPAGAAAIARAADADNTKPCRHMIEHLADGLADPVQLAATAGAGLLCKIDPHLLARQVCRHTRPIDLRLGLGRLDEGRRQCGFDPCDVAAEVLKTELHLVLVQPFGPPAELGALQLPDDEVEPFDLGLRLAEAGALGGERAHQRL